MSDWQVQDAKARLSELLNVTLKNGPQVVTRRGIAAAVLVPIDEWRRLQENSQPSLKAFLLEAGRALKTWCRNVATFDDEHPWSSVEPLPA
jgi:prevent-host-death family protein